MQNFEQETKTLSAIIQSIGDGLVVTDLKGYIKLVNKSFEDLLGFSKEEVLDKYFFDIVKKVDENGKILTESERLMRTDSNVRHEKGNENLRQDFYYVRKDGSKFPVYITSSAVLDGDNQIGIVQIFKDITQEKEIEKAKADYVALASHQMRTPLTTVRWYAEMLRDDSNNLTEEQKNQLNKILEGHERINGLIAAFLKISKIDMGQVEFKVEEFHPKELFDEILRGFNKEIKQRELTLRSNILDEKIHTDPKVFEMILTNLLSNSIFYNKKGGDITIKIEKNNSNLKIDISDTGVGIPEVQKSMVFQKLFRGDNVRRIDTVGNGLSLYITFATLSKIGGMISFKSLENEWTKFQALIPLK